MKRFENAEIGDLVYCGTFGSGVIKDISSNYVTVEFINEYIFDKDGYLATIHNNQKQPLYYRKGKEVYLTERPDNTNWNHVKQLTPFYVKDESEEEYQIRYFACFYENEPWFLFNNSGDVGIRRWKYIKEIK